jgi:heme/copper-type cytochrome/quinol oxidase subunit 2
MKSKIVYTFLFLFVSFLSNAQCAMCRAVLESEEGQSAAEGINNGIVYLMVIPYLLVGGVGFLVYKKLKNK